MNEEPDAESDQEEGNNAVDGKVMEEARIAYQEDAAKADQPEGAGGEAVTRYGEVGIDRVGWRAVGRDRGNGWGA
ncbi:hypothetical protein RBB78_09770 [Tunturiibacter empetritectus]|uniref:hypothetical protein n=1 Tax=Tunturiibacter empetritectus TaxID=3069691 RepID=UPI003D9B0B3F